MRTKKIHKINLNGSYPCPCCKRGRLSVIALTEALGCDRCQQIFVIEANEQTIEQLANSYGIEARWRWQGNCWKMVNQSDWRHNYLPVVMCTILVPAIVFLILGVNIPTDITKILLLGFFLTLFAMMVWLAYRN